MSTDEIRSATDIGRLMNAKVFEFLCSVVRRVSDTLPAFMQGQLDEFNEKKAAIHLSFPDHYFTNYSLQDGGDRFHPGRVRDVEILLAEEKFNQKLLRFVRLYRSYISYTVKQGKQEPTCSTKWIYRHFPRSGDYQETKVLPASNLIQLIFERCSLRTDEFSAKIVYDAEQEAQWHRTVVPVRRAYQPPENYQPTGDQYLNPSGHLADHGVFTGHPDEFRPSRDVHSGYGALSQPEVPEMVRKMFGDRIPSTEELRQAVTNHVTIEENQASEKEDAVTRADKLVEAAIAKSCRKRGAPDTSPILCPKTPRPDNHVTSAGCKSKLESKSTSDERADRKMCTCTHTSSGLCKDEIKTECTDGNNACSATPKTPVVMSWTPGIQTTGCHVVKKEHVTANELPLDDGIPAGPLATNAKIVEGSCYSDCIY